MPTELPTTLLGLFIVIVLGQATLLAWLVRGVKSDQSRIADVLDRMEKQQVEIAVEARAAGVARATLTPFFAEMISKIDLMAEKMIDVMLRMAEGQQAVAKTTQKTAETVTAATLAATTAATLATAAAVAAEKANGKP